MSASLTGEPADPFLAIRLFGSSRVTMRVFASTGNPGNKKAVLPTLGKLAAYGFEIFATEGTSAFLDANGVPNRRVERINRGTGENAKSLFARMPFDLVVHMYTDHPDVGEWEDGEFIRAYAVDHKIALFTEPDLAVRGLERLIARFENDRARGQNGLTWNPREDFMEHVLARGGFVNLHAHFDKAFTMHAGILDVGERPLQEKWLLSQRIKEGPDYSPEGLYARICKCLDVQIKQGVTVCRSLIDADAIIGLRAIEAALEAQKDYAGKIRFEIGVQPLGGVLDPNHQKVFVRACELADVVGGLPSKDRGFPGGPEAHVDFIMSLARDLGKRLDVHVDQENSPEEDETRMLATKTIEHGMQGRVSAVHAVSLACKTDAEQDEVLRIAQDAELSFLICPSAALSMEQRRHLVAPIHNSIAPAERIVNAGLGVGIAIDNMQDIYMPIVDGDMWTEIRMFMEATRRYNFEKIANIACNRSLMA